MSATPAFATEGAAAPSLDLLSLVAVSVLCYLIPDQLHELLGHGGACLLVGGHFQAVSSVAMDCRRVSGLASRIVDAGGCVVNLLAAALLVPGMRLARRSRPWLRYFLWLLFTANVFEGGGYLMVLSFAPFGDWNAFVQGLSHPVVWRAGLTALGAVIYFAGFFHARRTLEPFLGREPKARVRRAWRLAGIPYLVIGLTACAAGALNPLGAKLLVISAAASSFGGNAWLPMIPQRVRGTRSDTPALALGRSPTLLVAGILGLAVLVLLLGPGLPRGVTF